MNETRRAVKVGLFVFIGLILIGALLIQFSKSSSFFTSTYEIKLEIPNAAGLAKGAAVQMAGVTIGSVEQIELSPDGRKVTLHLKIEERYMIPRDAQFVLEQAGFLGDQYVSVDPAESKGTSIHPGETIQGQAPFNIQKIARSAAGLIEKVDETVSKLNQAITQIDETLLSQQTLTNLTEAVSNFRSVSERALTSMGTVERVLHTNAPAVSESVSNLVSFSSELKEVSGEFRLLIASNREPFNATMSNIVSLTARIDGIVADVQQGKGLAGGLMKNEEILQYVSLLTSNINVASSNLNKKGLFRFMLKP